MSTIIFGYDNLVDASDVTITHSAEVTGFEAENVQAVQLSEKFRTTVLNPGTIKFDFGEVKQYGLIAALGTNATPWRNLAVQGGDLTTSWTPTGCSVAASAGGKINVDSDTIVPDFQLTDDTSTGEHKIALAGHTLPGSTVYLSIWVVAQYSDDLSQFRLSTTGASGTKYAEFDLDSGGSVLGSSGVVSTSLTSFSVSGLDYFTAGFVITTANPTLTLEFYNLKAGATSYTGTSDKGVRLCGVQMESITYPATAFTKSDFYRTSTVQGSLWLVLFDGSTSYRYSPVPQSGDLSDRSTIDNYYVASGSALDIELKFWDPDNANSQIDIGRVFIGPVYQPTVQTVTLLDQDYINGRRRNTYGLNFITKSEANGAVAEMRRKLDIRPGQQWESMDGQISRPRAGAVLVIANPAETTNADQELLYGYINRISSAYRQSKQSYSVTHGEPMFQFTCEVEEIIA